MRCERRLEQLWRLSTRRRVPRIRIFWPDEEPLGPPPPGVICIRLTWDDGLDPETGDGDVGSDAPGGPASDRPGLADPSGLVPPSERRPSEDDLREVRALDASLHRLYAEKRRLLARRTTGDDATAFLWWVVARPWVRPPDQTIPTTEGCHQISVTTPSASRTSAPL
jgi:hypothetical protein